MSTIWTFEDVYRGEDYMPKFGESLREHAMKIINFEKKNVIPLTNNKQKLDEKKQNLLHLQKKKSLTNNTLMIKIITKIKTIVIILVSIKVLHIVLAI